MKFTTAILHIVVLSTITHGVKATPVKGGRQLTTRNLKKKNSEKGKRKISKEPKAPKSKTKATTSSPTGSPTGNPTSAPTVDTYSTCIRERNEESAAELESNGVLQTLIDGRVLVDFKNDGYYRAGAAEMYSPLADTHIRPYDGCLQEAFGLNNGNYTDLVCDSYLTNDFIICTEEPTCNAEEFARIEYRAMKGEYLKNEDDLLKLSCYESPDFSGIIEVESAENGCTLTCDYAPELPIIKFPLPLSEGVKDIALLGIMQLQGAIQSRVPGGFSNELISLGKYFIFNDDGSELTGIEIGDSQFAYMEAILGPKGFSTELAIKSNAIDDYALYHVTNVEGSNSAFHALVMGAYFSQKYSCQAYNDNDRDMLSDYIQFYYGNNVCARNLGTYLATVDDNPTSAFEELQKSMTVGGTCEACTCINEDVLKSLLDAEDVIKSALKTGESALTNGCGVD